MDIARVIPVGLGRLKGLGLGAACLALLILLGCSGGPSHVGKWEGRRKIEVPPGADPRVAASLEIVELIVKENNRFTLLNLGMPLEGTVRHSQGKSLLYVDTAMLQPIGDVPAYKTMFAKPFELRVNGKDRRTLISGDGSSEPVDLKLESD